MTEDKDVRGLRTLGADDRPEPAQEADAAPEELQAKALELLKAEFAAALELKAKLRAEAKIGGDEKGRDVQRSSERLRSLVASLEGMNKFALKMGLITAADSRELFADAMRKGLHEGWTPGA